MFLVVSIASVVAILTLFGLAPSILTSTHVDASQSNMVALTFNNSTGNVKFLEQSSFVDSAGRANVMGTVRNVGQVPIQVEMGVNVFNRNGSVNTIVNQTYGRIIWPSTDSPFKLTLPAGENLTSSAFVSKVTETNVPEYSILTLNYTNMAVGESRSLTGTVKNNGPFDVYGLSIFASVHDKNMTQLDSVRSNIIPLLRVGEQESFSATPDAAIKSKAYYYSCAGTDLNAPITTIDIGNGKFLAFDLEALAKVSSLGYDNNSRSLTFDVTHYSPNGGPISLKLPQSAEDQSVAVLMDGSSDKSATVKLDGRTISIDMFIPKGQHHVEIQNVTTVPEYPIANIVLATSILAVIILVRQKLLLGNRIVN